MVKWSLSLILNCHMKWMNLVLLEVGKGSQIHCLDLVKWCLSQLETSSVPIVSE